MLLAPLLFGGGLFVVIAAASARRNRRVADLRVLLDLSYLDAPPDSEQARKLLVRSGVLAEKAFADTPLIERARATVARSDWQVTAGELLAVSTALAVGGLLLGIVTDSFVLGGLLAIAGAVGPFVAVERSVSRRRQKFDAQLPDVLDLLAASLESGAGLSAALALIIGEVDEPASSEFGRVLAATRLGTSLSDALASMAERLGSEDLALAVQAITVQQRTGGRLAGILRTVAETMRGREELRRELAALTAEGRLSAYVLGGLPFLLAGLISLVNPDYLTPLFTTPAGLVMTGCTAVLMTIAFFAMSRIVRIEV